MRKTEKDVRQALVDIVQALEAHPPAQCSSKVHFALLRAKEGLSCLDAIDEARDNGFGDH